MTEIALRPAALSDIAAITAIYRPAVVTGTASFEIDPPDENEMARRYAAIVEAGYPYLVAERGGALLGYAYANAFRPRPAYRFTVEDSIYVSPDAQGLGVGGALLERLLAITTEAGFRQMIAVIGDSARAPSIQLHRRAGFTFAGTYHAVGYKHGRWLDSVLMQRALGVGDATPPPAR